MLDEEPAAINITGEVRIRNSGINISRFHCENATCRDTAALAMIWAIGELQRNLCELMEKPSGGNVTMIETSRTAHATGSTVSGSEAHEGGELAQANALLEHAMDHASKHGSEGYASGKAADLLALFARVLKERDAFAPDAARWRHTRDVADPAWTVSLFENFDTSEFDREVDAAMAQRKV